MVARIFVSLAMSLSLLLGLAVSDAAAASGSISIGNGGADDEVGSGFYMIAGFGWPPAGSCMTGRDAAPAGIATYRFALEFPLSELPAAGAIIGASLALRTARHEVALQTAIYGYVGDGAINPADVEVSGTPVLFTPTTSAEREGHDVTTLLTPDVVAAGWAGFSLRQEPLAGTTTATWDCPVDPLYPVLTIRYTTPDPKATPTPEEATVPDTATIGQSGGSFPLNTVAGMAFIGYLIWLAIGSGRFRRRLH